MGKHAKAPTYNTIELIPNNQYKVIPKTLLLGEVLLQQGEVLTVIKTNRVITTMLRHRNGVEYDFYTGSLLLTLELV